MQRVATVGWNDQDFALSLGVVPVVTREWFDDYNSYPWVQQATGGKGVETFGSDEIDYEAVAAAQPDLILGIYESIDQPTYDRLSQIAPTVIQSSAFPDEETPWDVQLVTTGQALGREEQALALVDQVNANIAYAADEDPANPRFRPLGRDAPENDARLARACPRRGRRRFFELPSVAV